MTLMPLLVVCSQSFSANMPNVINGAEKYTKEMCLSDATSDCIDSVCMNSSATDCPDKCRTKANDKCKAILE